MHPNKVPHVRSIKSVALLLLVGRHRCVSHPLEPPVSRRGAPKSFQATRRLHSATHTKGHLSSLFERYPCQASCGIQQQWCRPYMRFNAHNLCSDRVTVRIYTDPARRGPSPRRGNKLYHRIIPRWPQERHGRVTQTVRQAHVSLQNPDGQKRLTHFCVPQDLPRGRGTQR